MPSTDSMSFNSGIPPSESDKDEEESKRSKNMLKRDSTSPQCLNGLLMSGEGEFDRIETEEDEDCRRSSMIKWSKQ